MAEDETPPLLHALLEAIAAQLGMGRGQWRAEFVFDDGRLRSWYRHEERLEPHDLRRFDEVIAAESPG